jgi:A/G-specific adenine glycosylase
MFKTAHKTLYRWYETHGRHDLPWRNTDDPYRIWVSEIMLQQTQVKTVLERFYFPFLETFPTLQELADAPLDDVLKQWEGLGYYTRARNLHKSAQLAAPRLPQTVEELKSLPGIGQSTAHAIAAFAFHTPVPIMDANVKRILYRVFGVKKATDRQMWEHAHRLFDEERPFDYNQAMMDVGATLCLPKKCDCPRCPFQSVCRAFEDDPLAYPQKTRKKAVPVRRRQIVIHRNGSRYALAQRTSRFLSGLWGFIEYEVGEEIAASTRLGSITHQYSHFRLEAEVYLKNDPLADAEWFTLEQIGDLALSGADHKALALLPEHSHD